MKEETAKKLEQIRQKKEANRSNFDLLVADVGKATTVAQLKVVLIKMLQILGGIK